MSVIHTKQNMVCAYEPEADDLFVQVAWHGPAEDGRHLKAFEGPPRPIEDYDEVLAWAVGIADQMRFPLHIVPLRAKDDVVTDYMRRGIASLSDQQRGGLRRLAVTTLAEVMRDCDEPDVRADAFKTLADLGVIHDD